jgi:hypothetical protein
MSGAFVCADLILGGYDNPIPLEETFDAVYVVGKMLPRELRCTALGGLSITPSALAMPRLKRWIRPPISEKDQIKRISSPITVFAYL